jgi:hypothetical protein
MLMNANAKTRDDQSGHYEIFILKSQPTVGRKLPLQERHLITENPPTMRQG